LHNASCDDIAVDRDDDYTLILTKGVHLISRESADAIRSALELREAVVDVLLDPFGAVDGNRMTTIAVGHIVALTRNPPQGIANLPNVTALRARRRSR